MKLTEAKVTNYRSIDDSGVVEVEPDITCLVGKNESGKTAFLQALRRLHPTEAVNFDVTRDYPRRRLTQYERRQQAKPGAPADLAVRATYELSDDDVAAVEKAFGAGVVPSKKFEYYANYANQRWQYIKVDEAAVVRQLIVTRPDLDARAVQAGIAAPSLEALEAALKGMPDPNESAKKLLTEVADLRAKKLTTLVWAILEPRLPRFMYFDDYGIMAGAASLDTLAAPDARNNPKLLALLDLLELAGTAPAALKEDPNNYDEDLFDVPTYIKLVQSAYPEAKDLKESDLPVGPPRIIDRIDAALKAKGVTHFSHFGPARAAIKELSSIALPPQVIENFEAVFRKVNALPGDLGERPSGVAQSEKDTTSRSLPPRPKVKTQ